MAIPLKEALSSFFEQQNITEKIIDNSIHDVWVEIVGENISKATKIEKIKNNTLYIKTKNSAWRSELSFQKESLKLKIFEKLPKIKIKEIRFI